MKKARRFTRRREGMMKSKRKPPVKLQRHCWNLSVVLQDVWQQSQKSVTNKDGVLFEWSDAAEWLELAAGVQKVDVLTGSFDQSLMFCGSAMDYEDARSECLSMLAGQLTMFIFVWGAFETVGNMINPPSIPAALRKHGENSLVDRVICLLRSEKPFPVYTRAFDCLNKIINRVPHYQRFRRSPPLPAFMGNTGVGIDFVRRIRNQFAHGAAKFPRPDDWGENAATKPSVDESIIGHCTLITLFTIQMLLKQHFVGEALEVRGPDGEEADIHEVLETLHTGEADTGH